MSNRHFADAERYLEQKQLDLKGVRQLDTLVTVVLPLALELQQRRESCGIATRSPAELLRDQLEQLYGGPDGLRPT